jgi:hypothetical protein
MILDWLNPFRQLLRPVAIAIALAVVAVAGGRYLWPVAIVPGLIFCVIGARIAYGHRGADDYLRLRASIPWWGSGTSPNVHRQIEGGILCVVGIFLVCLAAAGFAAIA